VNAVIDGNDNLREARRRLSELNVRKKDIDFLSHFESSEHALHLAKTHEGHRLGAYGFLAGIILAAVILVLNQWEADFLLFRSGDSRWILGEIWNHLAGGALIGGLAGFIVGRRLPLYIVHREKSRAAPQFRHLVSVEVGEDQKEDVAEALRAVSESVDLLDNKTEIELGLKPKELF
jgi:hypothetical protein